MRVSYSPRGPVRRRRPSFLVRASRALATLMLAGLLGLAFGTALSSFAPERVDALVAQAALLQASLIGAPVTTPAPVAAATAAPEAKALTVADLPDPASELPVRKTAVAVRSAPAPARRGARIRH